MIRPTKHRLVCTLALAGTALPAFADGFLEDARSSLTLRNFYMNRDYTGDAAQGKAEEWTQNFILDFKSGFTQGTVGLGMDVLGLYSVKL
ncbi:outer membrane porin, OprD family, partial [Pseudomonas delhiensis]